MAENQYIKERLDELCEGMADLRKTLHGNGRPGLIRDVEALQVNDRRRTFNERIILATLATIILGMIVRTVVFAETQQQIRDDVKTIKDATK